ncbi:MAG: antibiotic biosynthesis monooxygenase [Deltaproteobacteria bacterium]|nr:antibiotic biosynthesis monooxygenase [Deltaproteobacteria bacterium]MBW1955157.1 antibiotic biosynthesis monooxygenase [Deltaproteobacteria bacterium]MBW2040439.1 antibiotic biosynthesis monooxygenase [Deltaproteobacteria bacterium]MBW2131864.1 antibiotic biosynthesis monooxygenase [Deltaproteobacteria bacterium]
MPVKVIIRRPASAETDVFMAPLLEELRKKAMQQKGYISGETLKRVDGPAETMVISTWRSMEDWKNWMASRERIDIQNKIDTLIGKETLYEIYVPK